MWPIKDKENKQLLIKWPNLIPLESCSSLIDINNSGCNMRSTNLLLAETLYFGNFCQNFIVSYLLYYNLLSVL